MDLAEENNQLRKQLLQVSVQNALLMQKLIAMDGHVNSFLLYIKAVDETIAEMAERIPKQGKVREWVREENAKEMGIMNDLIEACQKEAAKMREAHKDFERLKANG